MTENYVHVILRGEDGVTAVSEGPMLRSIVEAHPILYRFGHWFLVDTKRKRSVVYRKCIEPYNIKEI